MEQFEKDITDKDRVHSPMHCNLQVDEPIEMSPVLARRAGDDPSLQKIEERITQMLMSLAKESVMV